MKMWTMTINDLTGSANEVREILASTLAKEGVIDQMTATKITKEYAILVVERGILGRVYDKIFGTGNKPIYQLVKLIPTIITTNDNNQPEGSA